MWWLFVNICEAFFLHYGYMIVSIELEELKNLSKSLQCFPLNKVFLLATSWVACIMILSYHALVSVAAASVFFPNVNMYNDNKKMVLHL